MIARPINHIHHLGISEWLIIFDQAFSISDHMEISEWLGDRGYSHNRVTFGPSGEVILYNYDDAVLCLLHYS